MSGRDSELVTMRAATSLTDQASWFVTPAKLRKSSLRAPRPPFFGCPTLLGKATRTMGSEESDDGRQRWVFSNSPLLRSQTPLRAKSKNRGGWLMKSARDSFCRGWSRRNRSRYSHSSRSLITRFVRGGEPTSASPRLAASSYTGAKRDTLTSIALRRSETRASPGAQMARRSPASSPEEKAKALQRSTPYASTGCPTRSSTT